MTKEECAIVTIYTGVAMLEGDDLEYLYRYAEKLMERPVFTHELAALADELKKRAKPDFIHLCRWASAQPKHNDISTSEQPKMDRLGVKTGETCTDTIGRQAAIEKFEPWLKVDGYSEGELNMLKAVLYELRFLPSAQPERTCVNCGRTANNGGWYADGGTRCPIEEHYALPKDGFCHLWEKRNVTDDDYPERREE